MAYVSCTLRSQILATNVEVLLYFPSDLPADNPGNEVKGVLTLLHGYTNSAQDWTQFTSASRYAADNGLALIMPSCGNCFYNNMAYGGAYFTFITQEMPQLLSEIFKLPQERDKNFIAGLSMGGYGALHIALSRPDLYAAAASFSGAVHLKAMLEQKEKPGVKEVFAPVFGNELNFPMENDLFYLAHKVAQLPKEQQVRVLCTCGRQDYEPFMIRPQNQGFAEHMKSLPLDFKYLEWDGVHEWYFWDKSLVLAIDYFLQNGYASTKLEQWAQEPQEV